MHLLQKAPQRQRDRNWHRALVSKFPMAFQAMYFELLMAYHRLATAYPRHRMIVQAFDEALLQVDQQKSVQSRLRVRSAMEDRLLQIWM